VLFIGDTAKNKIIIASGNNNTIARRHTLGSIYYNHQKTPGKATVHAAEIDEGSGRNLATPRKFSWAKYFHEYCRHAKSVKNERIRSAKNTIHYL
jgi:hypothetical protein